MQDANLDRFLARVRPSWFAIAACRQPHHGPGVTPSWFASALSREGRAAIAICTTCPARRLCLEHVEALGVEGEFGVWGGEAATTRELRRTKYQRPSAA